MVDSAFDRILAERRLQTVFQPIVRLDEGVTVGYEALVRGPVGTRFASADALLAEAYRTNRVIDLDWAARGAACRAALAAGLSPHLPLFLNIEPLALDTECPEDLCPEIDAAYERFQVVLEVTERSLDRDPRSLLDGVAKVRETAGGLAVDDVGANIRTLSMLSLLEPELIKLDLQMVHSEPTPAMARILDSVFAEAERSGATVLAEGVETARQADFARSMGVELGQGRYFGRPRAMPTRPQPPEQPLRIEPRPTTTVRLPFDATRGLRTSRATPRLLLPLGLQVGLAGVDSAESATLLALVPRPKLFGDVEFGNFARLAGQGVLTGVLGSGISEEPGSGIRGGSMEADDLLKREWAVVGLSSHSAGAMLARAVPGSRTEYEFAVTHDRERVIAAARCLLRRLGPAEGLPAIETLLPVKAAASAGVAIPTSPQPAAVNNDPSSV